MRVDRTAVAALAGAGALVAGGGTALAQSGGDDRGARCEERLSRIAERHGTSVAELEAQVKARLSARVDAALAAGRIGSERAAALEQRIAASSLCPGAHAAKVKLSSRGMLASAARYLELTKAELRAQLRGTSLGALAVKQGKSVGGLKAAMLAPAEARLERAIDAGRITESRADRALENLSRLADRLIAKTFPAG